MTGTRNLKYEQNFFGACNCMFTVIYALILRETVTLYGDRKLGYLWVVIQTIFNISLFACLRYILGASNIGGLPTIYFLLIGFTCWNIFDECIVKCLKAVSANSSLLEFPHVHPLDVLLARCTLIAATHIFTATVIILGGLAFGLDFEITHFDDFTILLLFTFILGFSSAIFFASLNEFYPSVGKAIPFILRGMFFVSGIFFSISKFPSRWKQYLELNPVLNIIEGMRMSVSHTFSYTFNNHYCYIGFICASLLCLGLLLEQASHRRFEL